MLNAINEKVDRDEEGFTLIELMVVVLIIAILLAIAIPTFLGARDTANARSAQSNLRNALTAEQTYWTNNQSWDVAPSTANTGSVANLETALKFTNTAGVKPGNSVLVTDDTTANGGIILTAAAKDNHCYSVEVVNSPVTGGVAAGTYYFDSGNASASSSGCSAPSKALPGALATSGNAAANAGTAWANSF